MVSLLVQNPPLVNIFPLLVINILDVMVQAAVIGLPNTPLPPANHVQACADRQPIRSRHAQRDSESGSGMRRQTANQIHACADKQPIRFKHAQTDNQSGSGMCRQTTDQVQACAD